MQLRTRRIELHSAVAKALERFHHNQLSEYADLIAYHFEAAKEFPNGGDLHRACGGLDRNHQFEAGAEVVDTRFVCCCNRCRGRPKRIACA